MKDFQGRTAVVTGGASGIGYGLAERFGEARMNVVLADIEEAALEKAVKQLAERQHQVTGVVTDTMRKDSIVDLLEAAKAQYGNVHILCNNAGVATMGGNYRGIWEVPDKDWEWTMGVNFYGVLYGIQTFVPHMLEHGEPSHIVNTASLAALVPGGGAYGVSKHGVLVISEALYMNLKAQDANIGVSVLCPGFVDTNIDNADRNRPAEFDSGRKASDEQRAMLRSRLEAGKSPAEIAEIVFESIERDALYILPHPELDGAVQRRVEQVLARGGLDMSGRL
ncbi:MAG: SDR family NAD(P)-dependent oxidoreductase [Pseudomonadales bacterium]|nr:SDR family NAD(P)-dependent oxidoreductase [Pseudomonadales bacterium]